MQGGATGLNGPEGLATTAAGTVLVANTYGESIAEFASTATGNVAPLRTIAGAATGLSFPDGIDVDAAGDIYVANQFAGVSEFGPAAAGNAAPIATISGAATGLSSPGRLAVAPPLSVATKRLPHARLHRRLPGAAASGPRHDPVPLGRQPRPPAARAAAAPRAHQRPPAPRRHVPLRRARQGRLAPGDARHPPADHHGPALSAGDAYA